MRDAGIRQSMLLGLFVAAWMRRRDGQHAHAALVRKKGTLRGKQTPAAAFEVWPVPATVIPCSKPDLHTVLLLPLLQLPESH